MLWRGGEEKRRRMRLHEHKIDKKTSRKTQKEKKKCGKKKHKTFFCFRVFFFSVSLSAGAIKSEILNYTLESCCSCFFSHFQHFRSMFYETFQIFNRQNPLETFVQPSHLFAIHWAAKMGERKEGDYESAGIFIASSMRAREDETKTIFTLAQPVQK